VDQGLYLEELLSSDYEMIPISYSIIFKTYILDTPVSTSSEVQTEQSLILPTSKVTKSHRRRRTIEIEENPQNKTVISVDSLPCREMPKKVVVMEKENEKDLQDKRIPHGEIYTSLIVANGRFGLEPVHAV